MIEGTRSNYPRLLPPTEDRVFTPDEDDILANVLQGGADITSYECGGSEWFTSQVANRMEQLKKERGIGGCLIRIEDQSIILSFFEPVPGLEEMDTVALGVPCRIEIVATHEKDPVGELGQQLSAALRNIA